MRRFAALLLALAACASPAASGTNDDAPDAGGTGCDGGVTGPLGQCLPGKGPCDECGSAADCQAGQACTDFGGCKLCTRDESGRQCSPSTCLAGDECCSGSFCVQPDDPPPCGGACFRGEDQCGDAQPCPDDQTCEPVTEPCSCGGPVMKCVPHCPAFPCGESETCENGSCVPKPCPAFDCGPDRVCAQSGGDEHGCLGKPCTKHADCAQGFCFGGRCRKAAGRCEFPRP